MKHASSWNDYKPKVWFNNIYLKSDVQYINQRAARGHLTENFEISGAEQINNSWTPTFPVCYLFGNANGFHVIERQSL